MSNITELTSANFEELVLKSEKPFLVDFWASWCGPCHALAPVIEAIATEKADVLSVGKLDIDDYPGIATKYRVLSIPTVILFKNGEAAAVSVGAAPKEEILRRLEPSM